MASSTIKNNANQLLFVADSKSYTVPAVGGSVDIQKVVERNGYTLIGIINAISNVANTLNDATIVTNNTAFLSIVNISNSSRAGTSATATWTNVYIKA